MHLSWETNFQAHQFSLLIDKQTNFPFACATYSNYNIFTLWKYLIFFEFPSWPKSTRYIFKSIFIRFSHICYLWFCGHSYVNSSIQENQNSSFRGHKGEIKNKFGALLWHLYATYLNFWYTSHVWKMHKKWLWFWNCSGVNFDRLENWRVSASQMLKGIEIGLGAKNKIQIIENWPNGAAYCKFLALLPPHYL